MAFSSLNNAISRISLLSADFMSRNHPTPLPHARGVGTIGRKTFQRITDSRLSPPLATDRGGASDHADHVAEDLRRSRREADNDSLGAGSRIEGLTLLTW